MTLKIPENLKYTRTHQWLRMDNGIATVGITDYGQNNINAITAITLPAVGTKIEKGGSLAKIVTAKGAIDIPSPISGKIIDSNQELKSKPQSCFTDPYGKGWIAKIKPDVFLDTLMTPEEYADIYNKI